MFCRSKCLVQRYSRVGDTFWLSLPSLPLSRDLIIEVSVRSTEIRGLPLSPFLKWHLKEEIHYVEPIRPVVLKVECS